MKEITETCSLGLLCQSSKLLETNNLKKCSYPFDWIFSTFEMIIDCIEDDFNKFLDKSYYKSINATKCGHSGYGRPNDMFNHRNPLDNEEDYKYYIRCVERFRELKKSEEGKLFISTIVNMGRVTEGEIERVKDFNSKLNKYFKNYTLLMIFHKVSGNQNHTFKKYDNLDILELHTLSRSGGAWFINNSDNEYLNRIIKERYFKKEEKVEKEENMEKEEKEAKTVKEEKKTKIQKTVRKRVNLNGIKNKKVWGLIFG